MTERSRRRWLVFTVLTLALAALTAAGCGGDDDDNGGGGGSGASGEALQKVGKGEGQVNLIAWAGYVEDGSTDPNVDWVSNFEKDTGCQVNVKIGATSDEMVTLMRTGKYDGVSASGDATLRLIAGGDVDPVNTDLVPNYKDVVKPAPDSWGVVFDPSSPYKGKVTAYDSPIYIADAALYLKATKPELKITNPYELDEKQFNAAIDLLKEQQANVGEYWSEAAKQISAFAGGDVTVGTTWQYQYFALKEEGVPVKASPASQGFLPKEGATGWSDTWMIAKDAKHPNCMYEWMNWIISPKANAQVAEYFGEAPAQEKACEETKNPNFCSEYHAEEPDFWKRVYYWETPLADCGNGEENCMDYNDWVKAWTSIKG